MMFADRTRVEYARRDRSTARLAGGSGTGFGPEELEARLVLALSVTAEEQFMLELLNRMRMNPQAELGFLTNSLSGEARSADPHINSALDFFNVSGPVLQTQWSTLTAVPPLAWDEALYNMAQLQSENMILDDRQEHNLPGRPTLAQRAATFAYNYTILGENIFAFAESVLHGHAAFGIDWGAGPNGIQNPPGHRQSMMSSQFREVGIRIIPETSQATEVGPLVVTQNFGNRQNFGDAWLLGVVFDDNDGNSFYSVGEGLGDVVVTVTGETGVLVTNTMASGGYQLQLAPGTYSVTFSGGGFGAPVTVPNVVVGTTNAKLDAKAGEAPPAPLLRVLGNGLAIAPGDSTPDAGDGTAFGAIDVRATAIVRTFTVRNDGTLTLSITGDPRVVISGDDAGVFTLATDLSAATLGPDQTLTFQISFDPQTAGAYEATVTIASSDPTNPEFSFVISGTGTATPDVRVFGRRIVPIMDGDRTVSSTNLTTFGQWNVVGQFNDRVYRIRNVGSADLVIDGLVRIAGQHAKDFRVVAQPGVTTIAPGAFTTFTVRFNPTHVGPRNAVVVFDSNDPDTARFDFAIRGSGLGTPVINVRGNTRLIEAGDDSPRAADGTDFGRVNVDSRNRLGTFVIRNVGRGSLRMTGPNLVKIMGSHAADFRLVKLPAPSVFAKKLTTFEIRFNPSEIGRRNAWVVITTNDPVTPIHTFKITGVGFETAS